MRTLIAILVMYSGMGMILEAQNLHISYFTEDSGLPSNQVRDVARDEFGFFWITCDGGLVRFDGLKFTDYSQQIPSRYVRQFCHLDPGLLITHDAGVSRIQPELDTAHISLYLSASILPEDEELYYPSHIFRQKNGDIWISEPGGGITLIQGEKRIKLRSNSNSKGDGITQAFFAELNQDRMVVAFNTGVLYRYDDTEKSLEEITRFSPINDLRSNGKELWIAGNFVRRVELDTEGKQIRDMETFTSDLGEVTALALDNQNNVYLGIRDQGLYYLERQKDRASSFIKIFSSNDPHRVNELPFKNIHRIMLESDDRLWICSSEGLGILQRRFFESIGSIPNANTTSICMMENGKVFVNFGDIYMLEASDLGFKGSSLPPFSSEPVTALTEAGNSLWAATSTGNLIRIDPNGRRISSVNLRPRGEGIYYLGYDSQERLWVCQAPEERPLVGIGCVLPNGVFKEYSYNEGLESRLLCLRETSNGRIYASGIGAGSYLYRYLPEEDAFVNLSLPLDFNVSPNFEVHDLTIDKEGMVWMASTNGLLRYDMDRVTRMDLGPGLTQMEIRAVMDMPDGSIWASTETDGLIRYKQGETVVIKEESGLPSKVMTYRCLSRDPKNRLWVGTAEGLVYSLDANPEPVRTQNPRVTSAWIHGIKTPLEDLTLFHDQELVVEFLTPAFHGFRTFYQYKLGNGTWSDPNVMREIRLRDLESGNFKLEIRARNEGGYVWSDPVSLDIQVRDYWYRNLVYLWSLALVILILILGLFVYMRRKQGAYIDRLTQGLQHEKQALEQRDADLKEVKKEIYMDQRQLRSHVLGMEILYRLISKITPGMKWDAILELISIDMLKLPGVVAFEIGTRNQKYIEFEGYSEKVRNYTSERIVYNPEKNLSSYCMKHEKPFMFHHIEEQAPRLLPDWDHRLDKYKSSISVPFFLDSTPAVLSVYSDKVELFDMYAQKAISVFVAYLEQIT